MESQERSPGILEGRSCQSTHDRRTNQKPPREEGHVTHCCMLRRLREKGRKTASPKTRCATWVARHCVTPPHAGFFAALGGLTNQRGNRAGTGPSEPQPRGDKAAAPT